MLSVNYGQCHIQALYAECHYAECNHAECHYAECNHAECHYAECNHAECHYAECRGAKQTDIHTCRLYRQTRINLQM